MINSAFTTATANGSLELAHSLWHGSSSPTLTHTLLQPFLHIKRRGMVIHCDHYTVYRLALVPHFCSSVCVEYKPKNANLRGKKKNGGGLHEAKLNPYGTIIYLVLR